MFLVSFAFCFSPNPRLFCQVFGIIFQFLSASFYIALLAELPKKIRDRAHLSTHRSTDENLDILFSILCLELKSAMSLGVVDDRSVPVEKKPTSTTKTTFRI